MWVGRSPVGARRASRSKSSRVIKILSLARTALVHEDRVIHPAFFLLSLARFAVEPSRRRSRMDYGSNAHMPAVWRGDARRRPGRHLPQVRRQGHHRPRFQRRTSSRPGWAARISSAGTRPNWRRRTPKWRRSGRRSWSASRPCRSHEHVIHSQPKSMKPWPKPFQL